MVSVDDYAWAKRGLGTEHERLDAASSRREQRGGILAPLASGNGTPEALKSLVTSVCGGQSRSCHRVPGPLTTVVPACVGWNELSMSFPSSSAGAHHRINR